MSPQRHAALGLLFLVAFGVLGYFTLFKTDVKFFGEPQQLSVWFQDVGGLREGQEVRVAGVQWGKVTKLDVDTTTSENPSLLMSPALPTYWPK